MHKEIDSNPPLTDTDVLEAGHPQAQSVSAEDQSRERQLLLVADELYECSQQLEALSLPGFAIDVETVRSRLLAHMANMASRGRF